MSGDFTDRLPRDTAPILEQIVAELRALREETHATRMAVETLGHDIRAELATTRRIFREEVNLEASNLGDRLAALERRVSSLEERQPAP